MAEHIYRATEDQMRAAIDNVLMKPRHMAELLAMMLLQVLDDQKANGQALLPPPPD